MKISNLFVLIILIVVRFQLVGQNIPDYNVENILPYLKVNANKVIRNFEKNIEIIDLDKAEETTLEAITIFNEANWKEVEQIFNCDKYTTLLKLEVKVYNNKGVLLTTLNKKDFPEEVPFTENVTDTKIRSIKLPRYQLPITVEIKSKILSRNLMHLCYWSPQEFKTSIERAVLNVKYPSTVKLNYLTKNLATKPVQHDGNFYYSLEKVTAINDEPYRPFDYNMFPLIVLTLEEFSIDQNGGKLDTWENFANFNSKLNKDRLNLPKSTEEYIKNLVSDCTSDTCKIYKIYHFLQKNTRYFSIQLGIGGWQTIPAEFVDKNKYGDCKALTNYTVALLNTVGIKSFRALIYSSNDQPGINDDFPNPYFNHVIACVPLEKDTIWLECTSQDFPAGWIGSSNSNRQVLLFDQNGGEKFQTPKYGPEDNRIDLKANIKLNENGDALVDLNYKMTGVVAEMFTNFGNSTNDEKRKLLNYVLGTNNFSLIESKILYEQIKTPKIIIQAKLQVKNWSTSAGNYKLFPLLFVKSEFNEVNINKKRSFPIQLSRFGSEFNQFLTVELPAGYQIEKPEAWDIVGDSCGSLKVNLQINDQKLIVTSKLSISDKIISTDKIDSVIEWIKKVQKTESTKIAIKHL
jgi:hypothetical protein